MWQEETHTHTHTVFQPFVTGEERAGSAHYRVQVVCSAVTGYQACWFAYYVKEIVFFELRRVRIKLERFVVPLLTFQQPVCVHSGQAGAPTAGGGGGQPAWRKHYTGQVSSHHSLTEADKCIKIDTV